MPHIPDGQDVTQEFYKFWDQEKQQAYKQLCEEE
jgi:hypothetical protein